MKMSYERRWGHQRFRLANGSWQNEERYERVECRRLNIPYPPRRKDYRGNDETIESK